MKAKERYKEKMAEKMKKCAVMRDTYKVPKLPGAQECRTSVLDSFPISVKARAQQPKNVASII
jgi:hypothetical protein